MELHTPTFWSVSKPFLCNGYCGLVGVVVEVPAAETPVVKRLFLDNKKEIEFLGQKGPSNTEVESEVDEPVQPVHNSWSTARINALA